jgi:tetratricopeptide (TPR) repeat protein
MKLDNLLFGVIGLLIGAIIGFVFANSVNRSTLDSSASASTSSLGSNPNPALPPDHPPVGGMNQQEGSIPQVTAAIERARAEPQSFEAQMTAGDLYYQIQRLDEAVKFYEAASKLRPDAIEPLIKLGDSNFDAEKFQEAEKWYVQALEKEPRNKNVRTDLGLTFFLREPRDLERAIKEYKAALAIDPRLEIALQNLALAYREGSDDANYRKTVEQLRAVNPDNPLINPRNAPQP